MGPIITSGAACCIFLTCSQPDIIIMYDTNYTRTAVKLFISYVLVAFGKDSLTQCRPKNIFDSQFASVRQQLTLAFKHFQAYHLIVLQSQGVD